MAAGIGGAVFLLVVGAIASFGFPDATPQAFGFVLDVSTSGYVLMAGGALSLLLSLAVDTSSSRARR